MPSIESENCTESPLGTHGPYASNWNYQRTYFLLLLLAVAASFFRFGSSHLNINSCVRVCLCGCQRHSRRANKIKAVEQYVHRTDRQRARRERDKKPSETETHRGNLAQRHRNSSDIFYLFEYSFILCVCVCAVCGESRLPIFIVCRWTSWQHINSTKQNKRTRNQIA